MACWTGLRVLFGAGLVLAGCVASPMRAQEFEKFEIPPSDHPVVITSGAELRDFTYACDIGQCHLSDFMERVGVCALLVMKGGERRVNRYDLTNTFCQEKNKPPIANDEQRLFGIASVMKSITSTLLGFALLRNGDPALGIDRARLNEPISELVTGLAKANSNGAYADVPIERVLLMRSGADFDEYGSDARRLRDDVFKDRKLTALAFLQELDRVKKWFKPIGATDGKFNYAGVDTQAIGALVQQLSGAKLTEYLWAKLWDPVGMESRAKWALDADGMAAAYCCFNATAPDLLRFGQFVLDRGVNLQDKRLLSEDWFDLATKAAAPDGDAIPPGNPSYNKLCADKAPTQYRYQWWLFPGRTDFTAIGIAGQFIHIYPDEDLVIVQIAGWSKWDRRRACESMDAHTAIAAALRN